MAMNGPQPNLISTVIPPDFLTKVYLGRCAFDYKPGCTTPGGLITDFNIWNRALTEQEAVDWTSCKSNQKGNILNWDKGTINLLA